MSSTYTNQSKKKTKTLFKGQLWFYVVYDYLYILLKSTLKW